MMNQDLEVPPGGRSSSSGASWQQQQQQKRLLQQGSTFALPMPQQRSSSSLHLPQQQQQPVRRHHHHLTASASSAAEEEEADRYHGALAVLYPHLTANNTTVTVGAAAGSQAASAAAAPHASAAFSSPTSPPPPPPCPSPLNVNPRALSRLWRALLLVVFIAVAAVGLSVWAALREQRRLAAGHRRYMATFVGVDRVPNRPTYGGDRVTTMTTSTTAIHVATPLVAATKAQLISSAPPAMEGGEGPTASGEVKPPAAATTTTVDENDEGFQKPNAVRISAKEGKGKHLRGSISHGLQQQAVAEAAMMAVVEENRLLAEAEEAAKKRGKSEEAGPSPPPVAAGTNDRTNANVVAAAVNEKKKEKEGRNIVDDSDAALFAREKEAEGVNGTLPPPPPSSVATDSLAFYILCMFAGILSALPALAVCPIDVAKVRLQAGVYNSKTTSFAAALRLVLFEAYAEGVRCWRQAASSFSSSALSSSFLPPTCNTASVAVAAGATTAAAASNAEMAAAAVGSASVGRKGVWGGGFISLRRAVQRLLACLPQRLRRGAEAAAWLNWVEGKHSNGGGGGGGGGGRATLARRGNGNGGVLAATALPKLLLQRAAAAFAFIGGFLSVALRGWEPLLIGHGFQGAVKYGMYEFFKNMFQVLVPALGAAVAAALPRSVYASSSSLQQQQQQSSSAVVFVLAAACAEFLADIGMAPFETIKIRMQAIAAGPSSSGASSSVSPPPLSPASFLPPQTNATASVPASPLAAIADGSFAPSSSTASVIVHSSFAAHHSSSFADALPPADCAFGGAAFAAPPPPPPPQPSLSSSLSFRYIFPVIASREGLSGLYKTFVPLTCRQVPLTTIKFVAFEQIVRLLFSAGVAQRLSSVQVAVLAGVLAGIICATLTHPADTLVTKIAFLRSQPPTVSSTSSLSKKGVATVGVGAAVEVTIVGLARQLGLRGLMGGLAPRLVMVSVMTAMQWAIYDGFKTFAGLPTSGGKK